MDSTPTALKTAVVMSHRGFESLSLRQSLFEYEMTVFESFQQSSPARSPGTSPGEAYGIRAAV